MNIFTLVKLIFPIFFYYIYIISEIVSGSSQCDTVPYVRVFKKRNGEAIESLNKNGFLDLTKHIHKILCINGPAVLYGGVEVRDDGTYFLAEKDKPVQVYPHSCKIINQLPTAKAIELRDQKRTDPTLMEQDVYQSIIPGTRAAGIYLVSAENDYYAETSVLFRQQGYNYLVSIDDTMRDASFVTVTPGPFCLKVNLTFDIHLEPDATQGYNSVCRWTLEGEEDQQVVSRYKKIFNGSLSREHFRWYSCSNPGNNGPGLGPYPVPNLPTTSTMATSTLDPFSIISPFMSQVLLARARQAGRRAQARNQAQSKNFQIGNLTNLRGAGTGEEEEMAGDLFINLVPENCIIMLDKGSSCSSAGDADAASKRCKLFGKFLGIDDPNDVPPPPPSDTVPPVTPPPPPPPYFPKYSLIDKDPIMLRWKKDVLDLTSEIYGKICEPFPKDMPFSISRILEYYLTIQHKADLTIPTNKRQMWNQLLSELNRCNSMIRQPMLWYWDNQEDLASPDPVDPVQCLIDQCTPGCANFNTTTMGCSSDLSLNCPAATPTCPDTCAYDQATNGCVDAAQDQAKFMSEKEMNSILENDVEDCSSKKPKCSVFECIFQSDATCGYPNCKVTLCAPPMECKPTFNKENCEPRTEFPDSGAIPASISASGSIQPVGGGASDLNAISPGPPIIEEWPFKLPYNQEVIKKRPPSSYNFDGIPLNVLVITNITAPKSSRQQGRALTSDQKVGTIWGECLFYFQDKAEADYELNIAIDMYWKIWTTVIGYCNKHYQRRKAETFTRLYNTFFEDFLEIVKEEWMHPTSNDALRIILANWNSEKASKWMDVCLESAYIVSNSSTYRPPRPLKVGDGPTAQANYFEALPDYIATKFHPINITNPDEIIHCT